MFLATAFAIGPPVVLYLIARSGATETILRAFSHTTLVYRIGAGFYGLGLLFGFITALNGSISLTTLWLLLAYALVLLLIGVNFAFERWTHRVADAMVGDSVDGSAAIRTRTPIYALIGMTIVTLLLVYVMIVKPSL